MTQTVACERRRENRLPQEGCVCNLGSVLDLSQHGMRVRSARPRKGHVQVRLLDVNSIVELRAEVRWTRRLGFRSYDLGLRFCDPSPGDMRALRRIAIANRPRRELYDPFGPKPEGVSGWERRLLKKGLGRSRAAADPQVAAAA